MRYQGKEVIVPGGDQPQPGTYYLIEHTTRGRSEAAMLAGMAGGCGAWNDAMGFDLSDQDR